MAKNKIEYTPGDSTEDCNKSILLAFDKKKADLRKEWLASYDRDEILLQSESTVSIPDFINKDLIHFSNSDNIRSIPSMCDGLKPSQRKVLFACIKKNLMKEMKVAQLAGVIGTETSYHHGNPPFFVCNRSGLILSNY